MELVTKTEFFLNLCDAYSLSAFVSSLQASFFTQMNVLPFGSIPVILLKK